MKLKKGIIFVISLVLLFGIVLSPISIETKSSAYADELPTEVEKGKILSVLEIIQNGIAEEDNKILLDLDYAKSNGLSSTEIDNLKLALADISVEELNGITNESKFLEKEILKQDDIIQIEELTAEAKGRHAAPPTALEKTLKVIFGTIVGMTIATTIVQDMYKLGANKACHKWGNNRPKVKSACKTLGYW